VNAPPPTTSPGERRNQACIFLAEMSNLPIVNWGDQTNSAMFALGQKQTFATPKPMSALGQKQTCALKNGMSSLPRKADICSALAHVYYRPEEQAHVKAHNPKTEHGRMSRGLYGSKRFFARFGPITVLEFLLKRETLL
jgi:hypothetical protein